MKTHTTTTYTFDELPEEAKQKAIEHYYDINVDFEWWDSIYEDATRIGLKITSFDLDRRSITGDFTEHAEEAANAIVKEHGDTTDTYAVAKDFLIEIAPIKARICDEDGYVNPYDLAEEAEDAIAEFKRALLEEYLAILREEYRYLTSDEKIAETLRANEYDLTLEGRIYR